MAEYVYIQNYTRNGQMGISHVVFDQIAAIATNSVLGATVARSKKGLFLLHKPIACQIRNGLVDVKISVIIEKSANVQEVCLKIQEEVASALTMMTELIPFKIIVEVDGIK
ncbi:MAG: Asp23/Gls24 family envelope stress response protein [Bacilli bacterium]|jgi:uncharacterized alkaline shock family protein YloU|nr:Asp23/Gls24 family envelope stress response protein [Bacilli bacterium]MDD3388832.1 Asp23/Gls24 family envelope stress response protein [Bacilli bacterium]MDD4345017.1 Asp23/Gls24 family envelope stress response protein [Bacilli bacterium]MDD4520512.1 Asp23/Gls24 family envelope stress response protein [Bacilli bacterium]MDY0399200.1 Asp23/Gls24 family envelope stress response protein [Bacilli bacterium]